MSALHDILARRAEADGESVDDTTPAATGENPPGKQQASTREGVQPARRKHVARAELVLANPAHLALKELPIGRTDPLQNLANAVTDVRPDLGETVDVCLDLIPLNPAKVRHLATRISRETTPTDPASRRDGPSARTGVGEFFTELIGEFFPAAKGGRTRTTGTTGSRGKQPAPPNKLNTTEPVFAIQVLLRSESEIPGRAQAHLRSMIGAFDAFQGENYWAVRGFRIFGRHIGADTILYRRRFDKRFVTGMAKPRRNGVVTATEIAGLLKPPTAKCQSPAVERSRGYVPPTPRELPVYRPGAGLIRLGHVNDVDGEERLMAIPMKDLLFSGRFGKAGFGKTEEGLAQAIDIARNLPDEALGRAGTRTRARGPAVTHNGGGVWFLDPHADGWNRAKPYLSDPELRDRLWEVNLTVRGAEQKLAGWNPLSMEGFGANDIEDRVDAVVTSFATALNWGDTAPRAKSILTKACEALCYLAMKLPPDCAPTIFQIPTLIDNQDWREGVLRHLPESVRNYWRINFPKLPPDATTVITNPIYRLRTSPTLSAFLGSSRTTYDVRHAMDTGKIVFVCTTGSGETNKLITSFVIYDLFRAGRSRADTPTDQRRRFDAFIDELAAVDGASRGHLAAILEQLRKYKVALHAMNQMPERLTKDTRNALLQNQSLLMTSAAAIDGARTVAREFGPQIAPATVVELEKYHHVATATIAGQRTTPFKFRGLHVDDEFAEHYHPEWNDAVDKALDKNLNRRPIGETLAELDELDDAIYSTLNSSAGRPPSSRGRPPTRSSGQGPLLTPPVDADGNPTQPGNEGTNVVPLRPHAPSPYQSTVE